MKSYEINYNYAANFLSKSSLRYDTLGVREEYLTQRRSLRPIGAYPPAWKSYGLEATPAGGRREKQKIKY